MRQVPGLDLPIVIQTSNPVDGDSSGLDMTAFSGALKVWKYALWLYVTGSGHATFALWVQHSASHKWAEVVDGANIGLLGEGPLVPGPYVFVLNNLGIFARVAIVMATVDGVPAATSSLQEYIENNFTRGD